MSETVTVKVKQPASDRMGSSIESLIDVLHTVHDIKSGDKLNRNRWR